MSRARREVLYGLRDLPRPWPKALGLGAQHVLTMFGATISVPLLLGPAMGMDPQTAEGQAQIATLISSVMLCSGVATLIQIFLGTGLPIVQGVSFSFLAAFFYIIGETKGAGPAACMRAIAGAVIAGSIFEMAVGWSGLMGLVRRFLSPVVIGPVIMLIGLALFPHGAAIAGKSWAISVPVIVMILLFSQVLSRRYTFFKIFPILSAIVIGYAACAALTAAGVFGPDHPGWISLAYARESPWYRSPAEVVFPWGLPTFRLAFALSVLAAYLASMIESFGDYHAVSYMAGEDLPTARQINRGIGAEGLACAATGVLGGFASTSYSENIGLVGITRVGSRYVVAIGAVILILLGFFAKFGAFVATMPMPIVGALYCALFGLISAVGIQQLARADLTSDRNLMIAGFSLFMGLSLPVYIDGLPGIYEPAGPAIRAAFGADRAWIGEMIVALCKNSMGVAAIVGIILDNVIPGTARERRLE